MPAEREIMDKEYKAFEATDSRENGYDKLALAFIDAYESDRWESGRKEIVRGFEYLDEKHRNDPKALKIIDDVLVGICGYCLKTLEERAEEQEVEDDDDF